MRGQLGDRIRIEHMLEAIDLIRSFGPDLSAHRFDTDAMFRSAVADLEGKGGWRVFEPERPSPRYLRAARPTRLAHEHAPSQARLFFSSSRPHPIRSLNEQRGRHRGRRRLHRRQGVPDQQERNDAGLHAPAHRAEPGAHAVRCTEPGALRQLPRVFRGSG
jgi:hypothetical protein